MKKILFMIGLFILVFVPGNVFALNEVNVYFFYSETCNICEQERVYLQALKQDRYPNMRIYSYEVTNDSDNFELMRQAKEMFNESRTGVPYTVIGDTPLFGFSQGAKGNFQRAVYNASKTKYENKLGNKLGISHRTDLEGEVVEYKENSEYKIEEGSGKQRTVTPIKDSSIFKKYKSSMILVACGVVLLIVYIVLALRDRKRNRV